ncbi:hypothetical protein M0Q50_03775 [bacterium]|jgi:hypothetical protein|nr:hypothetical protein [bacterium]
MKNEIKNEIKSEHMKELRKNYGIDAVYELGKSLNQEIQNSIKENRIKLKKETRRKKLDSL